MSTILVADELDGLVDYGGMKKAELPLPARRLADFMKRPPGWSQVKLGKAVDCSGQQIGKLLKGCRTLDFEWAERLAPALGVDAVDFFQNRKNDTGKPPPYDDTPVTAGESPMPRNDEESELLDAFRQLDSVHKGRLIEIAKDFLALRQASARPLADQRA